MADCHTKLNMFKITQNRADKIMSKSHFKPYNMGQDCGENIVQMGLYCKLDGIMWQMR